MSLSLMSLRAEGECQPVRGKQVELSDAYGMKDLAEKTLGRSRSHAGVCTIFAVWVEGRESTRACRSLPALSDPNSFGG